MQGWYGTVRAFNYFLKTSEARNEAGEIEGDDKLILNYIGEGYFFRALTYYRMLALYGDLPIVTEVLEDNNEVILETSKRAPRTEVVRFILSDLDKAIERLYDRDHFKGFRLAPTFRKVASIPVAAVDIAKAQGLDILNDPDDMRKFLNDPMNKAFRTTNEVV